ncbi:MAG TPA: M20/M25/M40 family metallo-hydrolase [Thermoanaerobaculia bacterium]|nr:M20/M25/M40 family metallo-hydrolase [Thermoanaerobaculia bacterium]
MRIVPASAALIAFGLGAIPPAAAAPSAAEAKAIVEELVACGTRHSLSSWTDPKRGAGCGRDVALRRLDAVEKETGGKLRVVVDSYETKGPRTKDVAVHMENVYAILGGTDAVRAKTAYVVSGHFDSMPSSVMDSETAAPGADDDASGTAATILAARALGATPARATLIFAAVAGEEQGLLGSKRMLEWLGIHGYAVGGMITCDIVGATNGSADKRVRVFSEGGPDGIDSPGRQMARLAEDVAGKDAVRMVFRLDRFGRGGDHRPFAEAGHPAVRFTEPLEDYRHEHQTPRTENGVEYGDLPKFLDFDQIARTADVAAKTLAEMANAPAPPLKVMLGGAVTPNAEIFLESNKDPERASYEILWRETTEARWGVVKTIEANGPAASPAAAPTAPPAASSGAAPSSPLPLEENLSSVLPSVSTDNHYFAVRSVGKNGARSIAVAAVAKPRPPKP